MRSSLDFVCISSGEVVPLIQSYAQCQLEVMIRNGKYHEIDMWSASSLVLDRSVIMNQVPKHASFQYCFNDRVDHIVKVHNHSKGIFEHKPEVLTRRMHRWMELKYIYFLPSI